MSDKPKILIRIGSLRHGGAEKVLTTFLKELPGDKYEIDLLLNLKSGKYLTEIPSWIHVKSLNSGEMITTNRLQDLPIKAFRKIYQGILKRFPKLLYTYILKGKKYDLEFAAIHGMSDEILNSPNSSSKKVVWIHNDLSEVKGYTEDQIKKLFQFDAILVISEKIEQMFTELASSKEEKQKIKRIYNPIDTEEIIQQSQQELTDKKSLAFIQQEDKGPLFLSVGTVFPQKGFDRLLEVHKRLINEGFPHRIVIVGDGYDMPALESLRSSLKLEDTVHLAGFQSNPYPYFKMADYYLLSSRYEGFPTVLFEAIILQKNIIATEVSGAAEMLQNGTLGYLVDNSEEGIYQGMKAAWKNPEFFEKFQSELQSFDFPFSMKNSVQHIQSILDELH